MVHEKFLDLDMRNKLMNFFTKNIWFFEKKQLYSDKQKF